MTNPRIHLKLSDKTLCGKENSKGKGLNTPWNTYSVDEFLRLKQSGDLCKVCLKKSQPQTP